MAGCKGLRLWQVFAILLLWSEKSTPQEQNLHKVDQDDNPSDNYGDCGANEESCFCCSAPQIEREQASQQTTVPLCQMFSAFLFAPSLVRRSPWCCKVFSSFGALASLQLSIASITSAVSAWSALPNIRGAKGITEHSRMAWLQIALKYQVSGKAQCDCSGLQTILLKFLQND